MKKFLRYCLFLSLIATVSPFSHAEEDDGTFGEVADLDLESLKEFPLEETLLEPQAKAPQPVADLHVPAPSTPATPAITYLEVPAELKQLLDNLKGLSINGLAQIQLDHVHSKSPLNPGAKSKSTLNFRRLGLLFTKAIQEDTNVGLQVDFNVDANKAEIGKFFIKKKFAEPSYSLEFVNFAYEEISLGCETNISNIHSKRIEKSIAASYFKNSIRSFGLSFGGNTDSKINYKLSLGVSEGSRSPKHYCLYSSFSKKVKFDKFLYFRYGTCLGYIHRAKTSDDTFLATLFTDFSWGKWETIIEGFIQKNRAESRTPLGISVQQCYHILKNNTLVAGYSFIHTQNSRDAINPSQLERNAPKNAVGKQKPQFKSMHAIYLGDEWKINKNFKLIGGYELGLPSKAYANSSIASNTLHAFRLRLQIAF